MLKERLKAFVRERVERLVEEKAAAVYVERAKLLVEKLDEDIVGALSELCDICAEAAGAARSK